MSRPPINQFNRLLHVSGSVSTGSYSLGSRWNNERFGQNWDGRNCTAAMGALLIDAHTGGKITSNPARIRNAQSDWAGGIGWDDVNEAWGNLYPGNQLILPQLHDWYDVLRSLKEGRFVGIQGDYDQVPYNYQIQKGGTFDHAFALGGYRSSDGRVLLYDPLGRNARWVPQYVIRPAAEKLALAQRGTRGRLFVALTRVVPSSSSGVTYRYGGQPIGRGRFLARRDNVPVRSAPSPYATKVTEMDHRQDFACRQTVGKGDNVWMGTADGRRWVYRQVMWHAGDFTGTELIR